MMDDRMEQEMQGRYQPMNNGRGAPPSGVMTPGGPPAGGPPSFTGGTPSGSQSMNSGQQQRMAAPWMGDAGEAQAPAPLPAPAMQQAMPQGAMQPQAGRMPPPWAAQPQGAAPQGGTVRQYQGQPGAAQRSSQPMSEDQDRSDY